MRIILGLVAVIFASSAIAQTSETRSALQSQINGTIIDNNVGAVTPAIMRSVLLNQSASTATLLDSNQFSTPPTFLGQTGLCSANGSSPIGCSASLPNGTSLSGAVGLPLTTGVSGQLPIANGGTGTASPGLVAGANITVTGSWPDQVIAASGSGGSVTQPDDIRNYGAVCNSSASQALNNTAITNALAAQGSAFIPACSIYIANQTLASGQVIRGIGSTSQLIGFGTLTATGLIHCTSCTGFYVHDVSIALNSTQRTAGTNGVTCTTCNTVYVYNSTLQGNYGVAAFASSNVWIYNNKITAYGEDSSSNISGAAIALQGTSLDAYGYNCAGSVTENAWILNNIISGAFTSATPVGIDVCNIDFVEIDANLLTSPGYFGIDIRGSGTELVNAHHNVVYNPTHEGIIVTEGVNLAKVDDNQITDAGSSIDYGLTVDGSQVGCSFIDITNNKIFNAHNSGITSAETVSFSNFIGNHIISPNTSGTNSQAGINVYGSGNKFNQYSFNTIQPTGTTAGYIIDENGGGTGTPSHNVFMSNSGFNMSTGTFLIQAASTSNNNISYP